MPLRQDGFLVHKVEYERTCRAPTEALMADTGPRGTLVTWLKELVTGAGEGRKP
jgi:hypothetical protein